MVFKADRRILVSHDGSRILPEDHDEESGILLANKGQVFTDEEAEKLGLTGKSEGADVARNRAEHIGGGGVFMHHISPPGGSGAELDEEEYQANLRVQHPGLSEATTQFMGDADRMTREAHLSQVESDKDVLERAQKAGRSSTVLGGERRPADLSVGAGTDAGVASSLREAQAEVAGEAEEESSNEDKKSAKAAKKEAQKEESEGE